MALSMPNKLVLALSAAAMLLACDDKSNPVLGDSDQDSLAVHTRQDTVVVDVKPDSIVVNVGGDTINVNVGTDAKAPQPPKTSLIVKVLDARTRAPLAGAKVLRLDGKGAETLANGTCTFDSAQIGAMPLEVRLAGYATLQEEVQIPANAGKDPSPRSVLSTLLMHKTGATLKGKLLLASRNPAEGLSPAEGVKLELLLSDEFVDGYRTATTDADGDYAFTDLPEYTGYAIAILPRKFGANLYGGQALEPVPGDLAAGETRQLPATTLATAPSGSLYLLTAAKSEWQAGKKFTVWFSDRIDTSVLASDAVELSKNGVPVAIRYNWENVTSGLSIQPFQGDWPAGELTLTMKGFVDRGGNPLSGTAAPVQVALTSPFPLDGVGNVDSLWVTTMMYSPGASTIVDTNALDYNTADYTLHWNKVPGADAYEVYTRETPASVWLLTQTVYEDTIAPLHFNAPTAYKPLTRSHMVVAKSGTHRADFSSAAVLPLVDGIGPNLSLLYYSPFQVLSPNPNFNNLYGDTTLIVRVKMELRSNYNVPIEPLDTARTVNMKIEKPSYSYYGDSKVTVSAFTWISATSAIIEFSVPPHEYPYNYALSLDFSRMTDLSGNRVWSSSGKPVLVYTIPY